MSWAPSLRKLASLSWADRWLLFQAAIWLGLLRLAILLLPFRRIARLLELTPGEGPAAIAPAQATEAERIGWAVRTAAAHTPWQSACLAQALAGAALSRRRRLPCALYLGVAKAADQPGVIAAHAWLRCGDMALTGAANLERYRIVSVFRYSPAAR